MNDHTYVPNGLAEDVDAACMRYSEIIHTLDPIDVQIPDMGIKSIMQTNTVLAVVNGIGKADIVKEVFTGPGTPQVPASILQMHPDVILVGDETTLSKLPEEPV